MPRKANPNIIAYIEDAIARFVPAREQDEYLQRTYGIHPRTAARYRAQVMERWREWEREELGARRARFRGQVYAALREAYADRDWRAAGNILKTLAKIEGLEAPVEVRHSGGVEVDVAQLSPAERRRKIDELLARRGGEVSGGASPALPAAESSPVASGVIDVEPDPEPAGGEEGGAASGDEGGASEPEPAGGDAPVVIIPGVND